jgi:hypothetical protein
VNHAFAALISTMPSKVKQVLLRAAAVVQIMAQ